MRTSSGRLLHPMSYAARLLTAEDSTGTVADEFGRPLRLVVGVVTDGSRATNPTRDLARAETVVLPAYRRFRADESAYRVEPSHREPMPSVALREPEGLPAPVADFPTAEPVPSSVHGDARTRGTEFAPVVSPVLLVFGVVVALLLVLLAAVPAVGDEPQNMSRHRARRPPRRPPRRHPGVGRAAGTGPAHDHHVSLTRTPRSSACPQLVRCHTEQGKEDRVSHNPNPGGGVPDVGDDGLPPPQQHGQPGGAGGVVDRAVL